MRKGSSTVYRLMINVKLPRVIKITRILYPLPFKALNQSNTDFLAYLFALYSFARIEKFRASYQ